MKIITFIKDFLKKKTQNPPICAESAYVLSILNKSGNLDDLYNIYKSSILKRIKEAASSGGSEVYIKFSNDLLAEHKNQLITDLSHLNFDILHFSNKSVIISWEQK